MWDLFGEFAHLTPTLSFQEREPQCASRPHPDACRCTGSVHSQLCESYSRLRGEGRRHPVVPAASGGEAAATVRGRVRTHPLTFGCRLDALPDRGETRPSPRKRGEGMRTGAPASSTTPFGDGFRPQASWAIILPGKGGSQRCP